MRVSFPQFQHLTALDFSRDTDTAELLFHDQHTCLPLLALWTIDSLNGPCCKVRFVVPSLTSGEQGGCLLHPVTANMVLSLDARFGPVEVPGSLLQAVKQVQELARICLDPGLVDPFKRRLSALRLFLKEKSPDWATRSLYLYQQNVQQTNCEDGTQPLLVLHSSLTQLLGPINRWDELMLLTGKGLLPYGLGRGQRHWTDGCCSIPPMGVSAHAGIAQLGAEGMQFLKALEQTRK